MTRPAPGCSAFSSLPWIARIDAALLVAAAAALSGLLYPQWRGDPNLAHGLFLPVLSAILLFESRRDPDPRFLGPGALPLAGGLLLLAAGLSSFAAAVLYSTALGWDHALVDCMLCLSLVLALGAAWLALADRRVGFIPFNWQAAIAALLWIFASPPPPGAAARLALLLQGDVTRGVVGILGAFGIAAYQNGNVIELARTSVGVSEACSGVRSLFSCAVSGLFLSAVLVRSPVRRALVVAVSPAIGLAMNLLRSLLLTLLANGGVDIAGAWHDATGASILVVTTVLVAAFALWLRRGEAGRGTKKSMETPAGRAGPALAWAVAIALLLPIGVGGALLASRPRADSQAQPEPDLLALMPAPPPGWTARTTPDMDQYAGILKTRALAERVYTADGAPGSPHLTLYLAYWRRGQAPVSLVDAHTPDACWPGTGWVQERELDERRALGISGRNLPSAECRVFTLAGRQTRVWFWHLHGGRPLAYVDPMSAVRLLGIAWRHGFGKSEDQLFVRVSSDLTWEKIASEPTLRQFFENLRPLGL